MRIDTLEKALKHYLKSGKCDCVDDVLESLRVCATTYERSTDIGERRQDVSLITEGALDDLLNEYTYDVLGMRLSKHGDNMRFEYYAHDVRNMNNAFSNFTDEQLRLGYDILSDLWHDNEAVGCHNPDGTFARCQ